jgi:hypothetical protein
MHKTEVSVQDAGIQARLEIFHSPCSAAGIHATLHYVGPIRWEEPPVCAFTRERLRLSLLRKAVDTAVDLSGMGVPLLQLDTRWQDDDERALFMRYLKDSLSRRFMPEKACELRASRSAAASADFLDGFRFAS